LQHFINLRALKLLNDYAHRIRPIDNAVDDSKQSELVNTGFDSIHPLCRRLDEYVRFTDVTSKNVELLLESERICNMLNGLRVTFCKSGKDRTGMAVTLEQSRVLGERFGCGNSFNRIIKDATCMREYGCRLLIAEKNIGRKVYSINSLQSQFIPQLYRPPVSTLENLIKGGDLS
jgi:hypothetical protein